MISPRARLAVIDGLLLAVAVAAFGAATGAFLGTVKGYDGWGHLTKVVLVLRDFPSLDWNAVWYSGSPFFLGGYPPLFYLSSSALVKAGFGGMAAMNLLMVASYIAMAWSLFATVRLTTHSRLAGLVAAGLLLASPAWWIPFVTAGLYVRVFGMAWVSLAVLFATAYLRRPSTPRYFALVAASWGALSSHVVLGLLGVMTVAAMLLLAPARGGAARPLRMTMLLPPFLLAAYYYAPLAFYGQAGTQETAVYPTLGIAAVVTSLLPALPALVIFGLAWLRWRSPSDAGTSGLATALALVCAGMVLYAVAPVPRLAGLRSPDMLFFLAWFMALLAGLALGSIRLPAARPLRTGAPTMLLLATAGVMLVSLPAVAGSVVSNPAQPQEVTQGWRPVAASGDSYRVASRGDNLSVWFNAVYDLPQTRGYAAIPQVLNPDFQYWFDTTAWDANVSEEQRTFLFDWYAVRWIYVPAPYMASTAGVVPKLDARPDLYARVGSADGGSTLTFEYLEAAPIAAAVSAPVVLVIADAPDYDLLFRDLAYGGYASGRVITVEGGPYIDDYSVQDLARFDDVVVYGGRAHDAAHAESLLSAYVKAGGGLVVDAGLPASAAGGETSPVTSTIAVQVHGSWGFRSISSPVTDGMDFTRFGPPAYRGGPWTVAAATGLRASADAVLWAGASPVVVTDQVGHGRVVWSGLNLPYHADSYQNAEESRFLFAAMRWAGRHVGDAAPLSTAHRDGPEQMTVAVQGGARGVLFKESFFDRWHAYANGREATIYRAGPGFMYVWLPEDVGPGATVEWRYERSMVDDAGISVSAATLLALLTWPLWRRPLRSRWKRWAVRWAEDA